MSEVMDMELTYGEVIETRVVIAINTYCDEINGMLRNIELCRKDLTEQNILSDHFFTRDDIGAETMSILTERTLAITKKIKDLNK